MSDNKKCPKPEELKQLIDGSLPEQAQEQCTTHLDFCACCQTKLEEIALDGSNISKVVEYLGEVEPMATSAYWPVLNALKSSDSGNVVAGGDSGSASSSASSAGGGGAAVKKTQRPRGRALDFLLPASDPAYLGRLAQFDVMRVLGQGGMGIVVEAFDSRLQRNVALKILDPNLAEDDVAKQRFCREARAAASITHENVVAVHQVEKPSEDGVPPYLVMQLVSGESLEQRLARVKQLPLREVVRIGMQAAHGLAAAHAQNLIHRDIKPGNIMLEPPHDRVKLTDFGLARVADDVKLTRTGFVSGTPLYMAPEQALGGEADARSDLFSLGAVLYEMCAGQPPFTGNSAPVILKQIAEVRQRPLRELNPSVPEWLSMTIDRLLAKKPNDRIQSAAHLAELFEFEWALMKTTSEDVPTVCEIEHQRQVLRNRLVAAGIGAAFLAIGVVLGAIFLGPRFGSHTAAITSSAEPTAVLSANAGAVWSVSVDPTNDSVAMAVEDGSVRLWDLKTKSVSSTFDAHRGAVWTSKFSHKGDLLVTAGDDGLIKVWDPAKTQTIKTFDEKNGVRALAISENDELLFAGDRGGNIKVWPVKGDEPLAEAHQPSVVNCVAISPNGETLATAGSDKIVRLWNAKTLTPKLTLEGHAGPVLGLAFSPDGSRLTSVGWDNKVRVWNVASGQLLKSWHGHEGDIWCVVYSPDGTKIATGGLDGAVKLWNSETGELLATYFDANAAIHSVAFSPDGKLLASGGRDGAARIWKTP